MSALKHWIVTVEQTYTVSAKTKQEAENLVSLEQNCRLQDMTITAEEDVAVA